LLSTSNTTPISNGQYTYTTAVTSTDGLRVLDKFENPFSSEGSVIQLQDKKHQVLGMFRSAQVAKFSPNGKAILVISADGTARLTPIHVDDLLTIAACRLGRSLSDEEIARFQIPTTIHFEMHNRQCPPILSWDQ
jgi:hypothetical protein